MSHDPFHTLKEFTTPSGRRGLIHSLPALEQAGVGRISRLPVSIRIVLESILRNCDGKRVTEAHVRQLAGWQPRAARVEEIPFTVARILLQDFTGVPLLCDLAAMRSAALRFGADPGIVEPLVPVDLVVDHSVQVDRYNTPAALELNMKLEFQRNGERYRFIKWGMHAFDTFKVVPPGIGIVHQVNLEYLARGVWEKDGVYYPDTLVGTDSHTTMVNGLGAVAWGVGGIEAEAGMLGQPLYFLTPDVVGVHLGGRLREGVTATDLVLHITEMLRRASVVGKFVEFFGAGAATLTVPDRATIANMAPEYGATMGFFPVDAATLGYFSATGRPPETIELIRGYFTEQGMFGMPAAGEIDYSTVIDVDLAAVSPSIAGPKRPQDRIELPAMKNRFAEAFTAPVSKGGFAKPAAELGRRYPSRYARESVAAAEAEAQVGATMDKGAPLPRNELEMLDNRPLAEGEVTASRGQVPGAVDLGHGDVLIAAITSCTNTSNPSVMLAAGLLARNAVRKGLSVAPQVKTSLAPGSRVVTEYLRNAGVLRDLEQLGFQVVAYGCTTCIGNAGPLHPSLEETVVEHDLVCAAVLSGNRNFEARIHPSIKANFLMSPPLVVAFAIAGTVNIDLTHEPIGVGRDGHPVMLKDIWPQPQEIDQVLHFATDPAIYRERYRDFVTGNALWNDIPAATGKVYRWESSTYIAEPPFFESFSLAPDIPGDIVGARALAILGDSVTTDHISPAGAIKPGSPAAQYLTSHGVEPIDFNSYGSRRGNHEVMMRGTFANVRIKNLMLSPRDDGSRIEGGLTLLQPEGTQETIFDAAMAYMARGVPTIVFAGEEYGTGSSRDWAAKGPMLLGVKAVIARSFERIHRSNLVGMGVLPLQFQAGESAETLGLNGDETFDVTGLAQGIRPQQELLLGIVDAQGRRREARVILRIDTPIEVDYYLNGGILPFVLRELIAARS